MQVNGKELAVEVDGQGPAVLLVHGLGGTSNFFQPQADVLAQTFQVIRPEHVMGAENLHACRVSWIMAKSHRPWRASDKFATS